MLRAPQAAPSPSHEGAPVTDVYTGDMLAYYTRNKRTGNIRNAVWDAPGVARRVYAVRDDDDDARLKGLMRGTVAVAVCKLQPCFVCCIALFYGNT